MRIIDCIDNQFDNKRSGAVNPSSLDAHTEEEQRIIDSVHSLLYKYKNINRVNVLLKSLLDDKNPNSNNGI